MSQKAGGAKATKLTEPSVSFDDGKTHSSLGVLGLLGCCVEITTLLICFRPSLLPAPSWSACPEF